ncbi:DUF397 domain-containing protein [Amycolatopsis aidingensis]|uniref:DUF397 domain-containing protein n=1 Tax=Amycolatopsis aidingensis TaxID=2842453 RepID=UPI001C0B7E80|nr:DUF397 domain-containing protein [Amycolatopsis aidingensis]
MPTVDLFGARWRRSSHSGNGGDDACVEVAVLPATVAVRDSKAPGQGALVLSPAAWSAFVTIQAWPSGSAKVPA